MISNRI